MTATLQALPAEPTKATTPREVPAEPPRVEEMFRAHGRLASPQPAVLEGVSWLFYLAVREQLDYPVRITYDCGRMEIMTPPSAGHERPKSMVSMLLIDYLLRRGVDFDNSGSLTLRREELLRGCEPDDSYYIGDVPMPLGAGVLDLATHSPPNLVVEVDITSRSLDKEPICAAMGVAELWRWRHDALAIRRLRDDRSGYDDSPASVLLPDLPMDGLAEHVRLGREMRQSEVLRRWRDVIAKP